MIDYSGLRICPFCNHGNDVHISGSVHFGSVHYRAICHFCGSSGPLRETEAAAEEAWNQRADDERIQSMLLNLSNKLKQKMVENDDLSFRLKAKQQLINELIAELGRKT
jgi:Lar family restriction alleviation protein